MTTFDASGLPDLPTEPLRGLQARLGDFVLVGMAAVDLVARGLGDLPAARLTRDVDIAVVSKSLTEFRELTKSLTPRGDSSLHFWLDDVQVDVVPYGELAPDDVLLFEDTSLDVSGLSVAARNALRVRLDEDLVIRVASLASLVVLKLIAWTDRGPSSDDKDAYDVELLLQTSVSGQYNEELWADDEVMTRMQFDPERAGPYRVGREIASEFEQPLVSRLQLILSGESGLKLRDLLRSPLTGERLDALLLGLREGDPVDNAMTA